MDRAVRLSRFFTVAAGLVALVTLGVWIGTGAHQGWTQTSVTEMQVDEVTGIQFPVTRAAFVAGVEFVALGLGLALMLGLGGFALRRRAASRHGSP